MSTNLESFQSEESCDTRDLVQLPLRRTGKLVKPLNGGAEPPRALKSLAQIIENDLCHRCGSCVGICPTSVLGVDDEEFPVVQNMSACTDCDLCVKVCPGDEFNAPAVSKEMFAEQPDIWDMHGSFQSGYISYVKDPEIREKSTSGGFVSGLLISLLERGEIDGALVIKADPKTHYKGIPTIARSREEIFAATKSKYAIVPTNTAFREIREVPGRYAIVGLPCQIHGYHKAAALDKRIRDRVVLTVGLLCHAAIEHDPLKILFDNLGDQKKEVARFIYRVGKHPGASYAVMNNGKSVPVLFPKSKNYQPTAIEMMNILYRLYTPMRCMTCYDSMVEFADIAVGDPWMPQPREDVDFYQGYSYLMTRTERGEKLLHRAASAPSLGLELLKLSASATKTCCVAMGTEKRKRAFRLLDSRKRAGLPVPNYGFEIPKAHGKKKLKHAIEAEVNLITHWFCFSTRFRDSVLRFWISPVGFVILRANRMRRDFKEWYRNFSAERRRKRHSVNDIVAHAAPTEEW
ncbi:MAG: Coenzyme F420 hydrogenase/dehydrogenase, beta subunit C-terminal domain [Bdellovibrionota bacterium]